MEKSISVLIPTLIRNDKQLEMTLQCIESAKKTKIPYELVIVETESDYLVDYADKYIWERVKTTATKSINNGFRMCSGDYIVLLTNDVIVDDNWLEHLLDCFSIEDCGISTLATTQLGHKKEDKIKEGIWFSVAMFPRQKEYFDENYVNSWDDSDFIMRQYIKGKKMYRNYNSIVEYFPGQTQYQDKKHMENFFKNREYFINKYKKYKDMRIYKILTEGWIL